MQCANNILFSIIGINLLTGVIPTEFGLMESLGFLDLSKSENPIDCLLLAKFYTLISMDI